jgi:hypothetical protein
MRNSNTSITVFLAEIIVGKVKSLEPQLMNESRDLVHRKLLNFLTEHEKDLPTYKIPKKTH